MRSSLCGRVIIHNAGSSVRVSPELFIVRYNITLPKLLQQFSTNSIAYPSVEPVARCIFVAAFVSSVALALSGRRAESQVIACRFFVISSVASLFAVITFQKRKIIANTALFGAVLCATGLRYSLLGILLVVAGYDSKCAFMLLFGWS
jgi:hypothetical protein